MKIAALPKAKRPVVSTVEALEARIAPAMIYGVDDSNHLISFDSATPGTIVAKTDITGQGAAGEVIKELAFRPATGQLYALGIAPNGGSVDAGRIYTLDAATGALAQVGSTPFFSNFQADDDFGFDINPVSDRFRVVTDRDDNLQVNPNTGALVEADASLNPPDPAIVGLAFDRNFEGTAATTLFGLNAATGSLVKIGGTDGKPSPNGGVVTTVGPTGLSFGKSGFDIESHTGTAYAVIRPFRDVTGLYTIDLASGAATLVGPVGGDPIVKAMAVALPNDLKFLTPTTATYTDQDGDKVTVKITGAKAGAALSPIDFTFSTGEFGSQLKVLDLSNHGPGFENIGISIQAVPVTKTVGTTKTTLGDSFANVGYINATGVDLGKVTVNGDLGRIDAGNATTKTPGLAGLTVQSMGVVFNSQLPFALFPNQSSHIVGKLGALAVKADFSHELLTVGGGATDADGSIGSVAIGGSVIGTGFPQSSGIVASGAIGNVTIGGSLYGGSAAGVGSILAGSTMGNVTVGGSIFGGGASGTGNIESGTKAMPDGSVLGNMGNVLIKGSIFGGTAGFTGDVHAAGNLGSVTVLGSIVGGVTPGLNSADSGIVYTFGGADTGGKMGNVRIGGHLQGSNTAFSGCVFSTLTMGSATVGGSLLGGSGIVSGTIEAATGLGNVTVGGDVQGGTGAASGSIRTFRNGNIGAVTIKGALSGDSQTVTGILSNGSIGAVTVGEVRSSVIAARGFLEPKTAAQAVAIKSITVTRSIVNTIILGGYDIDLNATNPDATIGAVTVGGNWIATSLLAGATVGTDGLPGTADDAKIAEPTPDLLFSKIASVTIKGYAIGTPVLFEASDSFGIVAEQIGTVKVGLRAYALAPGTDLTGYLLGNTGDFRVREV